jgi:RNA polymerase sigma-70 factor (ECF subfamily)
MEQQIRTNEEWITAMTAPPAVRDRALSDLRKALVSGLRSGLRGWSKGSGREFDELIEDFVQETLLIVLKKIDTFMGEARFTTWALKIAVRVALTELRRRRWQDISLDSFLEKGGVMKADTRAIDPEEAYEQESMMEWLRLAMMSELSERQRTALTAVVMGGMPLEEVARRMETNRNALYKLLHDARLRLKRRAERDGMTRVVLSASLNTGG